MPDFEYDNSILENVTYKYLGIMIHKNGKTKVQCSYKNNKRQSN